MDFIKEIDARMFPIQYGWVDKNGVKHADMAHYAKKIHVANARLITRKSSWRLLGSSRATKKIIRRCWYSHSLIFHSSLRWREMPLIHYKLLIPKQFAPTSQISRH